MYPEVVNQSKVANRTESSKDVSCKQQCQQFAQSSPSLAMHLLEFSSFFYAEWKL